MESVTNEKLFEAIMDIKNSLNENNKTASQLTISVDEINQQHSDFKKELMSLKTNTQAQIKALESSQQAITESQNFVNEEFEKIKVQLDAAEERSKSAEANVIKTKADIQIMHGDLLIKQNNINSLEQYGRRNMLEINNIPQKENKNIRKMITAVACAMKIEDFNFNLDVDVTHHLQSKLTVPPIIIMFQDRTKRNNFYEFLPIFINESLTIFNRILFKKVREACKKKEFKYFWTNNGKIMCKRNQQSDVIIIKNEIDIEEIK